MATYTKDSSDIDILTATLYAEARGEEPEGQEWVVWVIKNRAAANRSYWGGSNMRSVCLHPYQFECWNNGSIYVDDPAAFENCRRIVNSVLNSDFDPTSGCYHYNNPAIEGYPDWTRNVNYIRKIGNHQFYRSK